ncbi:MAG TPA: hypothetical protein VFA87_06945 [Rhizomicrobium sp.]|nr:hypothetical protein [Rhizomicrobium sp.]
MPNRNLERAEYLRQRAKELRLLASERRHDHQREILLACALDYEELAEIQERAAKG